VLIDESASRGLLSACGPRKAFATFSVVLHRKTIVGGTGHASSEVRTRVTIAGEKWQLEGNRDAELHTTTDKDSACDGQIRSPYNLRRFRRLPTELALDQYPRTYGLSSSLGSDRRRALFVPGHAPV
jgi:hypothetical protein